MARGDVKWFNAGLLALGKKQIDLSADTLKLGIVTSATTPDANTADPRWGAGGGTNFSTNQVSTAGTAYSGPVTLASVTFTQVSNIPTLRAAVVTLAQDAGGFTNGAFAILYSDTDAGKRAIAFVDLGGPVGNVAGPLTLDWSGATNDILTLAAS